MRLSDAPDLASPRFKANPYPFYARLRAEAPVYRTRWPLWFNAFIVSRYDDALTVLKDERFSKEFTAVTNLLPRSLRPMTRNMIGLDPPDHTRLRALVNRVFTPRMAERFGDRTREVCGELLERAAPARRMELVNDYAIAVPLTIIADILGVPHEDRRQFASWSRQFARASSGTLTDFLAGMWAMARFAGYFRKLVARRRVDPGDDLITALIEAEEAGDKLSGPELIAMISLLQFAGYETTVSLIAVSALTLMHNAGQRAILAGAEDPSTAVEELLRFTSPADFATPRTAREDVMLSGVRIPRGALVLAGLGSANRDESQFPNPDRLDLTRDPNRHLAFGMGIHFCVGAPLARLEAQIALPALFRRFPDLRLTDAPASLRWRRGLLFRGLEAMPVSW